MSSFVPVLVIVGAWNTPLFSLKWIKDNLFDNTLPDKVPTDLVVSYDRLSLKRYKLGDLNIEISPNRLVFLCDQNDVVTLGRIIDIATNTLIKLPHTPVESFELNLMRKTSKKLLHDQTLPFTVSNYDIEDKVIQKYSFLCSNNKNHILNINVTHQENGTLYKFNFHHIAKNVGEIKQTLISDIFEKYESTMDEFIEYYEKNHE